MAQEDYTPEIISVYDDVSLPPDDNNKKVPRTQEQPSVPRPGDEPLTTIIAHNPSEADAETKANSSVKYNPFKDRRWKIAIGVILILIAAYLCISTFSYFTTAESDQSELDNTTLSHLANTTGSEIENIGGPAGALFSHRLFTYGLGIGVIPIFIYLILVGIWLLDMRKCNFWSMTFKTLLLAVTLSLVFGLIFYGVNSIVPMGGYHGYYINSLLIKYFSWVGAVGVSLAMIGCVIGVYFYDLAKLWRRYRTVADSRKERRRRQYEDRQRLLQATDEHLAATAKISEDKEEYNNAETEVSVPVNDGYSDSDPLAELTKEEFKDIRQENEENNEDSASEADAFVSHETEQSEPPGQAADSFDDPLEPDVIPEPATETVIKEIDSNPPVENEEDTDTSSPFKSIDPSGALYDALKLTVTDEGLADRIKNTERKEGNADVSEIEPTDNKEYVQKGSESSIEDSGEVDKDTINQPTATETQGEDSSEEKQKNDILEIKEPKEIEKGTGENLHFDPTAELPDYKMPTAELLTDRPVKADNVDVSEIEDKKNQIIEALSKYGIGISDIKATVGPTVTMYEIVPAEGVKIATIKRLEEDIAMALAALSTRIIAPIPGKSAIGIEVPNRDPQTVSVKTIFESKAFQDTDYELPVALGTTIDNEVYIADLAKMPHLLVAGATGKGKSVGMNVIINSLLYKKHPSELKMVLIDPKMVEFYPYRKLDRHYLAQVSDAENAIITDTSKVVDTLNSLCIEMDDRYRLLQQAEVVKITHYNDLIKNRKLSPREGHRYLPYIVVIVDEYADLLMTAGKEIETPIARLAQKARAVGIHVIIATQRPSANIITGVIKGNFPARIAFKVTSHVDSNIILGNSGAFQLIGNGDMLISQDGELKRVQCAFISTDEIKTVTGFINSQRGFGGPLILPDPPVTGDKNAVTSAGELGEEDSLLEEVARSIITSGVASTSNVQRRYSIGYNRAGRIMDQLQALGIVGPPQGGKPRDILVDSYQLEEILQKRY